MLLALLAGIITACEDRLNIEKHGNMGGVNDYYQTDEETEAAVAAMYLKWRTNVYVNWWYIHNFMADDAWAAGGTRGDNTELEQLNEFRFDTSNCIVSGLYSGLYTLIYYANLIIEKKTRLLKDDLSVDNSGWQVCTTINLRIMRYAEVLLMAAEAHFQAGNSSKALEYVNDIRERAQAPTLTSITMDDIKTEKRLELCYEGCRYEDLIRWGDAEEYLGEQGAEIPQFGYYAQTDEDGNTLTDDEGNAIYEFELRWPYTNSTYGFKDKHRLLPIPLTEIEVNSNMEQNEGW